MFKFQDILAALSKLAGIQSGATANSTDAQLRDRSTHTGTQAISTISGLQTELDSKASTSSVNSLNSDTLSNESSVTGATISEALEHIHNTKPTADGALTLGKVLIGSGDGHLEASSVSLSDVLVNGSPSSAVVSDASFMPGATISDVVDALNTGKQAADGDLASIASLTGTGFAKRTGVDSWALSSTVSSGEVSGLAAVATSGAYADLSGKPTYGTASSKDAPASGNATSAQVVLGSDTRLTDARTPTAHTHTLSDLTQSGATSGQVPTWNGTNWTPQTPSIGGSDMTTDERNSDFTGVSGISHLVTTGSSIIAVTLPSAGVNGSLLGVVKVDTGNGIVNVGSDIIHLCSKNDFVVFISTGSSWQILHRKIADRKVQFLTSGTWTKRPFLKWARVVVCNAGAGGGSGRRGAASTVRGGGSGGGGSPPVWQDYDADALGATETVVIGSPGTGGAAQTADSTNGNPGTLPGLSTFKNLAPGRGSPGAGGVSTIVAGGAGASVKYLSNGIGVTGGAGGSGGQGNGATAGTARWSGGGGGGAGIDPANGQAQSGQAGGSGGCDSSGNATMGTFDLSPAGGVSVGEAGTSGADASGYMGFIGGSGGGGGKSGSVTVSGTAGGAGGNGGFPGGGGGGGGSSTNGANSGKGGDGGAAVCIVWEFYE